MSKKTAAQASPIVKYKGIPVDMGGEIMVIPPLSLGTVEQMEERLDAFEGGTDLQSIKTVIDATHEALKRNYPDIDRATVAANIDFGNMDEIMHAVMDISGMHRKVLEEANKASGVEQGEA